MKVYKQAKKRIIIGCEFDLGQYLFYFSKLGDRTLRKKDWLTGRKHCKYLQYGFTRFSPRKMWNARQMKIYNAGYKILDDYYISPYCFPDEKLQIDPIYYFKRDMFEYTINHMNNATNN